MTDPIDRAATDQLAAKQSPGPQTLGAEPASLIARAREGGTRRAKDAAGRVLDKVGDRAVGALSGDMEALHREIAQLRNELDTLRSDMDAELALLRAEILANHSDDE